MIQVEVKVIKSFVLQKTKASTKEERQMRSALYEIVTRKLKLFVELICQG